jgi:hypothetical protein
MYQQFNEQFAAATRQFAETAAQVNRLALDNAGAVFGLQLAAVEDRANATLAFWTEATQVRDADGLKDLLPKAAQVARENLERSVATGQEVLARTVQANERIAQIAKAQFEAAARTTQSNVEQATRAAAAKTEAYVASATKGAKAGGNADQPAK